MRATAILVLLLTVAQLPAQDQAGRVAALKRQAQEVADAMTKDDHERLADLTHAKVVEKLGGRKKMIETLETIAKKMRSQWPKIAVNIQEPKEMVEHKGEWFGVVSYTMELQGKGTRVTAESFLIGVSADNGKNWTFVNAGNKSAEQIKQLLPNFPNELRLPTVAKAKVEKID